LSETVAEQLLVPASQPRYVYEPPPFPPMLSVCDPSFGVVATFTPFL
jgi:hypothetical protein